MYFRPATAFAAFLAAATVTTEAFAADLKAKMYTNELFGLRARADDAGYKPDQTLCAGTGTTCDEVCGAGYVQCPSKDGDTHCYNAAVKEICCSDGTGNSCDPGYYCTSDTKGGTWCCAEGNTLAQCAAAYSITDTLVSQTPLPTTLSTPVYNSTSTPTTTPTSGTGRPHNGSSTEPTSTPSIQLSNDASGVSSPAAAIIAIAGMFAMIF